MNQKSKCTECGWVGLDDEILTGPNPFSPEGTVNGCPECLSIDTITACCHKCDKIANCGTPTKDGYVWSCGDHKPIRKE